MTTNEAINHTNNLFIEAHKTPMTYTSVMTTARQYAKHNDLHFKEGNPAFLYEPGCMIAVLIKQDPDGSIEFSAAISPVHAVLDYITEIGFVE